MKTVCFIPARGGSVRIPRKNIRSFHGKPVIAYSIQNARECGLFDDIIISTDDAEIETLALQSRCSVHRRMADDGSTGTQEVAGAFLRSHGDVGICCVLYATAPLLSWRDLANGWQALQTRREMYAYSVLDNQWERTIGASPVDIGGFYWGFAQAFREEAPLRFAGAVGIPRERCCDINTEADWKRATAMYSALHKEEETA